jgi:hypothetical protein
MTGLANRCGMISETTPIISAGLRIALVRVDIKSSLRQSSEIVGTQKSRLTASRTEP